MSKEIGSAHNNLFQNILGREDMARDFVRYYMQAEIVGDLDLDTLEVASESYISDDLKESLSDIVLSLQLKDGDLAEIIYSYGTQKRVAQRHAAAAFELYERQMA